MATSEDAQKESFKRVFDGLDKCEKMLSGGKKFFVGNQFSYMDLRLFQCLIRFDIVYAV